MGLLDTLIAAADHAVEQLIDAAGEAIAGGNNAAASALQGAAHHVMDTVEQLMASQPGWPGGNDSDQR
jgi:hypothetical protein